jgi:putative phosphoesterase
MPQPIDTESPVSSTRYHDSGLSEGKRDYTPAGRYHGLMRIGLLSDTHGFLDETLFTHFEKCDELWHAGDFGLVDLLDRLRAFKPVRGVFGNIDGPEIRADLPLDLEWECEGLRVYMTHVGGYPGNYDRRAKRELERRKPGLFICGHSHITRIMRDQKLNLLHMNPGACGRVGWHLKRTALRFSVDCGKIGNVELIELGTRSSLPA